MSSAMFLLPRTQMFLLTAFYQEHCSYCRSLCDRLCKKVKLPRFVYPRKTTEELWDTVWGKRITGCRDDISTGGVNPYSRIQAEFRADFRVPFTLEEIVVECKEANIFTTGYK